MVNTLPFKAITLDLDDTIWPIAPTIERAERVLRTWLARHAPATRNVLDDRATFARMRALAQQNLAGRLHDLGAVRQEAIRLLLLHCGENPALAAPAYAVFYEARQRVQPFDGVVDALRRLSRRYPLVAVSNGNADVRRVGLASLFIDSVHAAGVGVAKPHPDIFREAAARAGVAPADVLHVGDDPAMDVVGARRAGMAAVWINADGRPWPDLEINPHGTFATVVALVNHLLEDVSVDRAGQTGRSR